MQNRYKKKLLMVLGLMLFLANGDNYAAASLLGGIAEDLNLTLSRAAMSVMAYMLAFGAFTLVFGPLSDRFGKVKVIIAASMGTAVFSMLGAAAFNLPSLIFFRAVNGAFGAGIFPVTFALIGETFDDEERQPAIAKAMGLAFLGAATATAVGGALAYVGSWRLVYLIYGIGELLLAVMMTRLLQMDRPAADRIRSREAYRTLLRSPRFMRLTALIFLVGFSVFGSFTYSGVLLQQSSGFNVFVIGLILSVFGIGTVAGGRLAPRLRRWTKNLFLVITGVLGFSALYLVSAGSAPAVTAVGLLGSGAAFILLQSTLVTTVQEKHPEIKGTVMSLVGFNLFLGGACGTSLNALLLKTHGAGIIFRNASFVFLAASLLAAVFVARFEMRRRAAVLCAGSAG